MAAAVLVSRQPLGGGFLHTIGQSTLHMYTGLSREGGPLWLLPLHRGPAAARQSGMSVSGEALSAGPMQTDPYALLFLTRSLYVLSVCKAREPCRRVKALYFLTTDMAISDDRIHQTECAHGRGERRHFSGARPMKSSSAGYHSYKLPPGPSSRLPYAEASPGHAALLRTWPNSAQIRP